MSILKVENLTKHFGGLAAVEGVNFEVNPRQILGLIGPNGAGKTTLFNVVTGVYKATRGKVIFNGHDTTKLPPHTIAKKGMVRTFQQTNQFMDMTVLESVRAAHYLYYKASIFGSFFNTPTVRKDSQGVEQSSHAILDLLRLNSWKDEINKNLPHGQQRAMGIAMALATHPKLLLLDEPLTGMNPTEMNEMMTTIVRIRDNGMTIMLVEHNIRAVLNVCDKFVVLDFGKKIAEGPPKEVIKNNDVIEAYLGSAD
jgi:branched-chain amino acid transport system ATP-binding protein